MGGSLVPQPTWCWKSDGDPVDTGCENFNLNKDKEKTKTSHDMIVLCKVKRRGTGGNVGREIHLLGPTPRRERRSTLYGKRKRKKIWKTLKDKIPICAQISTQPNFSIQ